jgi:spermidine synthase
MQGGGVRAALVLASVLVWTVGVRSGWAQEGSTQALAECGDEDLLAGKLPFQSDAVRGSAALVTDGTIAREGSVWDAPTAVVLERGSSSLTYDLGAARSVSAIYVQADANDTYEVAGSFDGTAGSFRLRIELENVVAQGPGLRGRAIRFAPMTVRYLRIGAGKGDNFFSLAEFAAYCRAPTPFPPAMRSVEPPWAEPAKRLPAPQPQFGGALRVEAQESLLVVALAMMLLASAVAAVAVVRRRWATAESDAAAAQADGARERGGTFGLSTDGVLRVLFLASGCAALIYEVVWLYLLRLVIGASALSVGIVLASFMGGMFLGSLLFARVVRRERDSLRVYAWLELGIGCSGLLMPLVLPAVRSVYLEFFGYGALGIALRALIAAALLLPPTALMGATLPAVARRYGASRRGTADLAALYAANTLGAVLGSLLSAFYLLAVFDIWIATLVAAALNFAIAGCALLLARRARGTGSRASGSARPALRAQSGGVLVVYVAAALSGLTALGAQVVWTRLLTLLFGATVYAFAIILAVFLAGLGLGSAFAVSLLRRACDPLRALSYAQLALVPALWLAGVLLAEVLPFASPSALTPVASLHALHVLRALDVILPASVLWGMSFPFALAAAGAAHEDMAHASGRVYAANTVGAIAGALGASFWAIPRWGTGVAQQCLVLVAATSAATLFFAARAVRGSVAPAAPALRATRPLLVLGFGALAAALLPALPIAFQAHGRYIWWIDPADQYPYVSEGVASTVAVRVAPDGFRNFHVSGRVEASNHPADLRLERMLGHLSALAHPHPEFVLVVGLGAGITAGALALHPEVKRMVICEIEPRVVGAASQFARENYGVLTDPRVRIVFDDARHFLATTRERFDVITSDPIHPWVRGNSVLFSREYYAIVKAKLKPHGIATQWVPLYETSEAAIQIQLRTFTDAFPRGTVWNSEIGGRGYDVVLLGSDAPLVLSLPALQQRLERSPRIAESLREVKIDSLTDLLATYGAGAGDMQGWLAGVPVNRDFSLKLEYISGLALNERRADPIYEHMTARRAYPETLFDGPQALRVELRARILKPR